MKALKIILSTFLVGAVVVSCTTSNYGYGDYGNNGRVYRSPDGTVYREGQVYRDRNGNTYRNGRVYQYGNVYGNNQRRLPPGQAKKVYGGNATDYAYGQTKKRNGYYKNDRWGDHRDDHQWEKNKKYKKGKKSHHKGKK